jgi:hypothetical protein
MILAIARCSRYLAVVRGRRPLAAPAPIGSSRGSNRILSSDHTMLNVAIAILLAMTLTGAHAADANDYPTEARADYVFVCMKTNGETREALQKCACSIDVIASLLPYERYVAAETVASLNQDLGQIGRMFRGSAQSTATSDALRRAQAEAEVRCF